MNKPASPAALIFMAMLSGLGFFGCATARVEQVESPRAPMTVGQAQAALVEAMQHSLMKSKYSDVTFFHSKVTYVWGRDTPQHQDMRFLLSAANTYSIGSRPEYASMNWVFLFVNGKPLESLFWENKERRYATLFLDAVHTLQHDLLSSPDADESAFAAFSADANLWREAKVKPTMSDVALTYKAVAEDAFRRKNFPAALHAYEQGLEKFPMWPQGHYNAAVLAAEGEDYESAAQHMHRYLVLVPEAPDAAAAKEKFLLWQFKAKAGDAP